MNSTDVCIEDLRFSLVTKIKPIFQPLFGRSLKSMGIYGFSSSDDDAEYTPPNEDADQDKDGDRYVILVLFTEL